MNCICDQYELPCGQQATQEDLLCDGCRDLDDHGYTGDGPVMTLEEIRAMVRAAARQWP